LKRLPVTDGVARDQHAFTGADFGAEVLEQDAARGLGDAQVYDPEA